MTPLRTADSIAANQAVRAWVNFDGANGNIRAAHNVSSVVRNGPGDYTVNFSTSVPSANYAALITCGENRLGGAISATPPTTSSFRMAVTIPNSTRNDSSTVYFAAIG
jgi:hypothetical protein